jgi:hypothetical protein
MGGQEGYLGAGLQEISAIMQVRTKKRTLRSGHVGQW